MIHGWLQGGLIARSPASLSPCFFGDYGGHGDDEDNADDAAADDDGR